MKNYIIVSARVNLKDHRNSLRQKEEILAQLEFEINELRVTIETLDRVTEVHNGVALEIWKFRGITIDAVDDSIIRSASIHQNAHNGWSWGLHLYNFYKKGENSLESRDKWFGACYPDYDEVMKFAKDWVAIGTIPTYEAFHTIDEVLGR